MILKRPVRRWTAIAVAAVVSPLLPGEEAHGYRFFRRSVSDSLIPGAAEAARWRTDVWGPFRSLEWVVSDGGWTEGWEDSDGEMHEPPFETREEVLPFVEEALAVWSSLPTATIQWKTSGFGEKLYRARDHKNAVRVHETDSRASWAGIFIVDGEIVECDVSVSPRTAASLRTWGMHTLIHEFGHCLGLAHAGMFPTWDSNWRARLFDTAVWFQDPKMSYGFDRNAELTHDDIVGASLLRPVGGWPQATGSVSGEVTMEGEPARFVRVIGTRVSDGELAESAGAFTDEQGRFRLEGLAPGEYLLVAGTMVLARAHFSLLDAGATIRGNDQYLLSPVAVSAGAETRAPPIALRRGREATTWRPE